MNTDGRPLPDALEIDVSKILRLKDYPLGTKIPLRVELSVLGAKASLLDTEQSRVTAFLANCTRSNPAFLDVRHRARGRCEIGIKSLKVADLGKLPFYIFEAYQAR